MELADLRQPDLVISRVAEVLGVHEEPRRPLIDTLADTLRPRRLLLALDNCEHLIEACAVLGRRVLTSSPGVRLLVTSREPLRVAGETVWEVALAIFRQVGARPQMARCLAGLGRVAMDLDAPEQARLHLTQSIQLSQDTGARLGISRGLEVFVTLAVQEGLPERAVRLAAAATALRQTVGLPPIPDARTDSYLASARHLGEAAAGRLWARGLAMSSEAAVALALQPARRAAPADDSPVLAIVRPSETTGQHSSPPQTDQSSAPP